MTALRKHSRFFFALTLLWLSGAGSGALILYALANSHPMIGGAL